MRSFQFLLAASGVWATTLPLYFEPNQGQAHPRVEFLSRGNGAISYLTNNEAVFTVGGSPVRMRLAGASVSKPEGIDRLPGISSYFRGQDRSKWHTGIPQFGKVRYRSVYPGIDLVYYGTAGNIEYDFQIAPGADPGKIHIVYEGTGRLRLDQHGDLILSTKTGEMRQKSPQVYQIVDGHRQKIAGAYKMEGRKTVGLTLAAYDRTKALIVDPVLQYSTFFGGPGEDGGDAVKVDAAGNIYIAAGLAVPLSDSNPFSSSPTNTAGPFEGAVIKFSPAQNAILFVAHVGSDAITYVKDLAIDSAGNMYLAGSTVSLDFPLVNPIVSSNLSGSFSPFISKISADGKSLMYSTYFGGHAWDTGEGVAVDSDGNAYFTGVKESADFPILNALYSSGEETGAFLAKISPAGSLLFSTLFLGMPGANRVVVDSTGVYMVGLAAAAVFPVKNSIQPNQPGQLGMVGAVKFSLDGQSVIYATMFGGSGGGEATAAAVDTQGNLYLTGFASPGFSLVNAVQNSPGLGNDGFVAEINPQGNALIFSTYLAGNAEDDMLNMAIDGAGNIYVTGTTLSTDFPVLNAPATSIPKTPGQRNPFYGFLTAYSPSGQSMLYSTLVGGSQAGEGVYGVATDATGNVYIVGATQSPDFPVTPNAYQPKLGGQWDVFLMTLSPVAATLPASVNVQPQVLTFTGTGGANQPPAQTVNVTAAAGAVITTTVSTASGGNWLTATLSGATQISVAVNTTGLAIGTYHGTVSLSTGGGTPASVSVTLSIPTAAPVLTSYSLTTASTVFPALTPLTIFGSGFLPGASATVYLNGALGAGQPNSFYIAPQSVTVVDSNTVQFSPGVGSATPITIAVTVTNTGSLESNALPILLGAPSPLIVGVQNAAAASQPNTVQPISPGEMITITGTDFGSPIGISAPANSGTPSTQLGNTRVLFNGIPVPVTYVSFAQINAVAPFSISGGVTASIVVEYVGVASAPITVQVVPSMTGLFTANATGSGQGAILNQDSTSNSASNAAALGSVVTMYATGMGTTNPALPDGIAPQNSSVKPVLAVSATIDGLPAQIVSAFAVPGMLGILQVSVQVPASAHTGAAIPVLLQVGSSQSQPGVTMATQ